MSETPRHLRYLRRPSVFRWAHRFSQSRLLEDARARGEEIKHTSAWRLITNIWDIWRDLEKKNLPLAAAGITYYLLLSLFPALTVLTAVLSYLPVQDGLREATSLLGFVMPSQVMAILHEVLARVSPHRAALLSYGLIITLWLASMAFKGLILGLDMVHVSNAQRPLWISRILAFVLTVAVGILLLIGVILTSIGPRLWAQFSHVMPAESVWLRLGPYVKWSVAALVLFTGIELLYVLGPSLSVSRRLTVPGATAATVIWLGLAWGAGFYFHHFGDLKFARFFGFLGTPVAFMIWLYCSATAILVGAEINSRLRPAKD